MGYAHVKVLHSYKVYRPDMDGGIPFVIATLSKPAGDDIENHILVARLKGPARNIEVEGVPVEAVASWGTVFSTPLAPSFPGALARHARQSDVVIHHAPFPLADLALARLESEAALIVYWHADIVGRALLKLPFNAAIRRTLERADRIIVADHSTMMNSDVLPAFEHKCTVVPYGADIGFWSTCTAAETARADMLRHEFPRMILAIGRLVPYKGYDILIQALRNIDAQVIFIGEGPLLPALQAQAARLGVADRVIFRGRIDTSEIKSHLHAAKAFAFPSLTSAEAFGIVQLEAMAAALPIVNTWLPTAVPGIARHDIEALTVDVGNSQQLAVALARILDEPGLASRLGQAAQLRAQSVYTQARYVARMKEIYHEVLAQKRGYPGAKPK